MLDTYTFLFKFGSALYWIGSIGLALCDFLPVEFQCISTMATTVNCICVALSILIVTYVRDHDGRF